MNEFANKSNTHEHCYHAYRGILHMVVPDGHTVQKCCSCSSMRTIHVEHMGEDNHKRRCDNPYGICDSSNKQWVGGLIKQEDMPKWGKGIHRSV